MPNFQTVTKENHTPQPMREPLCQMHDGTSVNVYYLRSKTDTVEDVSSPGFFDFMRDNFRSGDWRGVIHMVRCHLGEVKDGLTEVDLHVVDAPSPSGGPVVMALGPVKKFKPKV
jgi:hypothetical protein